MHLFTSVSYISLALHFTFCIVKPTTASKLKYCVCSSFYTLFSVTNRLVIIKANVIRTLFSYPKQANGTDYIYSALQMKIHIL